MSETSHNAVMEQVSVLDHVTVSLKEVFAALFSSWEGAVRRTDEQLEHVHDLRVSSRRAMAALEMFAEFLPTRRSERLMAKLDNVRKSAGLARDADVLAAKLQQHVLDEEIKQELATHLAQLRSAGQQTLEAFYDKCDRGEVLESEITELLIALRPRGRHGESTVDTLINWVTRQMRLVVRNFFADVDLDVTHLECLHQFRIRAKQFRYSVELLQSALPDEEFKKKSISELKKLLQRLGGINDHATAVEILSSILDGDISKPVHQELRRWRKEERRALRKSMDKFADWWTPRRCRRMRRRMKHAIREAKNACS